MKCALRALAPGHGGPGALAWLRQARYQQVCDLLVPLASRAGQPVLRTGWFLLASGQQVSAREAC
eukprot:NODE_10862_length_426_cov_5.087533_g9745_i0.p2 GENE.NODE_10862_length_426_cov_5.087533_g9745_i0~~NODE_10862_length_426_cov_5.087533_g9745_i0.p2  ORF type:complete len:65 (-),score=2.80 NODE_10862_length_426_cov_5.087533_g9745_i0:231-425(-)